VKDMKFSDLFFDDRTGEYLSAGGYKHKSKLLQNVSRGATDKIEENLTEYLNSLKWLVKDNTKIANKALEYLWAQVSAVATNSGLDDWVANNIKMRYYVELEQADTTEEMLKLCEDFVYGFTHAVATQKIENSYSPLVQECLAFVRHNINSKLTSEMISKALHFSTSYISHKFKLEMGISLSEFILKEKVSVAKHMIKSNIPLIQIADELGFCSQSHFSQRFKRETGMTPTQFKTS